VITSVYPLYSTPLAGDSPSHGRSGCALQTQRVSSQRQHFIGIKMPDRGCSFQDRTFVNVNGKSESSDHERTTNSFPTAGPEFDPAIASADNLVELKVIACSSFVVAVAPFGLGGTASPH